MGGGSLAGTCSESCLHLGHKKRGPEVEMLFVCRNSKKPRMADMAWMIQRVERGKDRNLKLMD